jgi:hypothetical protein
MLSLVRFVSDFSHVGWPYHLRQRVQQSDHDEGAGYPAEGHLREEIHLEGEKD